MPESSTTTPRHSSGRGLLALGLALPVVGIIAYAVQVALQRLSAPWYMPALATAGAGLVALSLWWRRTPWRILAAVVVVLLAGAQWAFMLAMGLPAYTGPVVAGRTFPAFRTVRADGTSFTENDLKGSQDSVLVFFRGRW